MNNTNGALDFESTLDNEKFIGAINEAERRVKGFSTATVKEGEKIDDAFKITAENIRIQKDVIAQIESQIKQLNKQIDNTAPGMAQNDLRKQAQSLTVELNGEKSALTMLEQQVKETESAHVSFRTQLRNVREELIQMEQAGLRGTDAYNALQAKAGQLNDAYKDAQQQMNVLANDEKGFRGVVSLVTGVTGAFAAAQGAIGLFAGENENLNKIMQKANFLMAITIGLQQASETFNKDSFFSLTLLKKTKEALIVTETKLATAFGISTAAARVFMATVTLGLSVAITGAIILIDKFVSKQKEAKKFQDELNKSTAESAYKPIASIEQLSLAWSKLGNNLKEKEKFIKDNAEKFKELGVEVNNVKDAENILIKDKTAFIEAQIAKAKAIAATQMASDLLKRSLELQLKMESTPQTKKVMNLQTGANETYENAAYRKLRKEAEEVDAQITKLYESAAKSEQEALTKISEAGIKVIEEGSDTINKGAEVLISGSIGVLKLLISEKQKLLDKVTNTNDYKKIDDEIKKLEERVKVIQGLVTLNRPKESLTPLKGIEPGSIGYDIQKYTDEMKAVDFNRVAFMDNLQEKSIRKIREYITYLRQQLSITVAINKEKRKALQTELDAAEATLDEKEFDNLYKLTDTFIGVAKIMEGIDESMAEAAKHAAVLVEGITTVIQGIASKNYSQAAAGATNLLMEYISLFDTSAEKEAQAAQILSDRAERFKKDMEAINNTQYKVSNEAGEERIKSYLSEIGFMNKEIDEKLAALRKIQNVHFLDSITSDTINVDTLNALYRNLRSMDMADENDPAYQYYQQLRELYETRQSELNSLNQELLGSSYEAISDTIRDGFGDGLSTVEDFADNTSKIIRNALLEAFQTKYIDKQIQDWYNAFGAAASDGLTKDEAAQNRAALESVLSGSAAAFEEYKKMMEDVGVWETSSTGSSSLTGSIKGVTEETASIVAGQINAVRINQAESLQVVRNQLIALNRIELNTSYNHHLQKLSKIVDLLSGTGADSTRARGL